jgi:hypothetical protein
MKGRDVVDRHGLDALKMWDATIQNTQLPVADKIWAVNLRIRLDVIDAIVMEAICSSDMSVAFYRTERRRVQEDTTLQEIM